MVTWANTEIADIIRKTQEASAKKTPTGDREAFKRFIGQFYAGSPPDDVKGRSPEVLCATALTVWEALQERKPGAPKIKVVAGSGKGKDAEGRTGIIVINDDMPFLVDSVTAELERMDEPPLLAIHPILTVVRDDAGKMTDLCELGDDEHSSGKPGQIVESVIHIETGPLGDPDMVERIRDNIAAVLNDVRLAVRDWQSMRRHAGRMAADFDGPSPGVSREQAEEVSDFLRWLHEDHYTFLGYRRCSIEAKGGKKILGIDHGQSLGVLTKRQIGIFDGLSDGAEVPAQFAYFLDSANTLLIIKANQRSAVHRRVHYDVVAIKIFDDSGKVAGLHMFVGLFTADVYTNSPNFVPVLRRKIDRIRATVGFRKHGHDGKRLQNIMENLPRDELFESSDDYLVHVGLGLLHLQERARTAVFVRLDQFERFASCLIYLPRDRFDTQLRVLIGDILVKAFGGRLSSFFTQVTDSALARIHYIIATKPGAVPKVDVKALEVQIARASRAWADSLKDALIKEHGEADGAKLFNLFSHAFPTAYREHFEPEEAVGDVARVLACATTKNVGIHLYTPRSRAGTVAAKIYNVGGVLALSDVIPVLENLGFRAVGEEPYQITPLGSGGGGAVWLHDFLLTVEGGKPLDVAAARESVEDAFLRVWSGEMESDGFNKLVTFSGLKWREVVILRAYAKYLRQAAFPFSQSYLESAFGNHPTVARLLVDMFVTAHDPVLNTGSKAKAAAAKVEALKAEVAKALDAVTNADEDRILRRYLTLVECTLRTNYFQKAKDGTIKSYVSMKLNSKGIPDLPLPRPNVEVFVYSPRVEAIHLRGGKVARGGIRWSDRREDFRSEILGLVKAQMVKNAVIVPTGSKGGFVVKRPPTTGGREAFQQEGIACYQTLQRGLLDITDNVVDGDIVPPLNVVRKDEDDPYLVVAADKGTATFSDIANAISTEYNFWLGDAFASGGSAGYDHKVMGITARGAWECVKRHFREMGVDTQTQEFTCAGVGDMSGDVFGNGMLMSKKTKLLAAFNHLHIFIDPNPDPAKSYEERARMFKLPRSNWTDYNAKLISKGGGIFERSAKSIKLSPEMKEMLGLTKAEAPPVEILNAILRMKVDLLFFGGIGTYVKSSAESHADASDRANDAIRMNGEQVRAKVIGEGANLGMTQRGRIEAAMAGVRINTDAIDNSAGVDCSDHEVNIKILLNGLTMTGKLALPARNKLLAEMTDEVAELVLRDNYQQSQTLSLMQRRAAELLEAQQRTMKLFEREGLLNRDVEFLPPDEDIQERGTKGQGLVRPELAVFLSYGKMWLYDKLINSDLPDDPSAEEDLINYFPSALRKKYLEPIRKHKLRREIIATVATNSFVNRVGPSFLTTLMDRTGLGPVDVVKAYVVTRTAFGLRDIWKAIEGLDNKVPAEVQTDMLLEVNRAVERSVLWLLRHVATPMSIADEIGKLAPAVKALRDNFKTVWSDEVAAYVNRQADALKAKGVPAELAFTVASLYRLVAANDILRLAETVKQPVPAAAKIYFLTGERFGMGAMRARTESMARASHWERLAVSAAVEELYAHQTNLAQRVMTVGKTKKLAGAKAVEAWVDANKANVDRYDAVYGEIRSTDGLNLAMLTVANRQLSSMIGG
ncbi:MAG: NAD-glutamate dehydrogenase [Rhodospirillaceae bacterium]|nr:NAD-glutamate dehydrogenase [Rhodospirillaceae bacterium]